MTSQRTEAENDTTDSVAMAIGTSTVAVGVATVTASSSLAMPALLSSVIMAAPTVPVTGFGLLATVVPSSLIAAPTSTSLFVALGVTGNPLVMGMATLGTTTIGVGVIIMGVAAMIRRSKPSTMGTTVDETIGTPVPIAKGCWTLVELSKKTGRPQMEIFNDGNMAQNAFVGSSARNKALFDPEAQLMRCEGWQENDDFL